MKREFLGLRKCPFVPRYARVTDYEAARQRRPTLFWVANGYTSVHRAGFSMFHLRRKTYGNVFGGNGCSESGLKLNKSQKRVENETFLTAD